MFKEVFINTDNFVNYSNDRITELSKVNLFVGQNNSGKSRLLRSIFEEEDINYFPANLDKAEINKTINDAYEEIAKTLQYLNSKRHDGRLDSIGNYIPLDSINSRFIAHEMVYKPLDLVLSKRVVSSSLNGHLKSSTNSSLSRIQEKSLPKVEELIPRNYSYQYNNLYFPALRGLRPLEKTSKKDYYKERTLNDYFEKSKERLTNKIYTGLTFYDELKRLLLGRHSQREKVRRFERFLSNTFFKGENVDLIPNIDDDVVYIKIGDEEDRSIYNLGDGIQMIIVLTYPLFFRTDEALNVFIEEPELFLHPGMQRILLDCFTDNNLFPKHQFYISTHSNHILDMTADFDDISIYTVQRNTESKKFEIKNLENADSDVLNLLGVKNSSVFLSNCTIWVEGITDRIYIRKYLEVYFKSKDETNLKEDIHYSFLEYGGGNVTHWSFLEDADPEHPNINVERLCGKLFLITDKDNAGLKKDGKPNKSQDKKTERHKKLKKKLGNRYYCLKSREIENLLNPEILKATIRKFESSNHESINFKSWDIEKYKIEKLGSFIDGNTEGLTKKYADNSGTVKRKLDFAKYATECITSIEDLSVEAKDLCRRIFEFIKSQNKTSL